MSPPAASVRRLAAPEWRTYRALRLRALADAPDAFGTLLEEARARPDAAWRELVARGARSASELPLVAEARGAGVGLAWARVDPDDPRRAALFQMWVAPELRRRGVGRLLLDAVVAWAEEADVRVLALGVTQGNAAAEALYRRAGFAPGGAPEPLRPGSPLRVQPMQRALPGRRDAVLRLVPWDPHWEERFARERARLADALGDRALRIEHHGSTAVPGLAAKPVIDIQVSVRRLQPLAPLVEALGRLGYRHHPHPDDAFAPFLHRPADWPHTHHVHLVEAGGAPERETLAFRDHLRAHPETAREYEALKRSLAPRYDAGRFETRQAYADAKGRFIAAVTARALAGGRPHEPPEP